MRRSFLAFGFLLFIVMATPAAWSQDFVWAKQLGGTALEQGQGVDVDASNNVHTVGRFSALSDFDPGAGTFNMTPVGGTDAFISKLDPAGNFVWAKQLGGTGGENPVDVAVDAGGNVYTVGFFDGTADFDPGAGTFNLTPTGGSNTDVFISKLDSAGSFVWAMQLGGTLFDNARNVAVDASANVYTVGEFNGVADFDPGPATSNLTSAGSTDVFISKLDSAGNFVWARRLGGTGADESRGVTVDSSGNVYTVGFFRATVDFDPGGAAFNLTSAGASEDAYIWKLDSAGNFVWARQLGGVSNDRAFAVVVAGNGNVHTAGLFQGTADFDPGAGTFNLMSAGLEEVFVSKLDSAGNFVWAKRMGGTSNDSAWGVGVANSGNVYTVGRFQGTADFDPGAGTSNMVSAGSNDVFISKLDSDGNFVWAMQTGSTSDDAALGLDVASDVLTVGYFQLTADFDPGAGTSNMMSAGSQDAFIEKLGSAGGAGAVPDGDFVRGVPLILGKAGALLALSWGPSCRGLDANYEVYEGTLGSFTSHVFRLCSTAGATSVTLMPSSANRYYLVVPTFGSVEGSYGMSSSGVERPAAATACLPQSIGTCP